MFWPKKINFETVRLKLVFFTRNCPEVDCGNQVGANLVVSRAAAGNPFRATILDHPLQHTSDGFPKIGIYPPLHFKPTAALQRPGVKGGTQSQSQLTEETVRLELDMFEELKPEVGVPDPANIVACCKPKTSQGRHFRHC